MPHCPLCQKPATPPYTPFCSNRCKMMDLHHWLSGSYAIPAIEPPDGMESDTLSALDNPEKE